MSFLETTTIHCGPPQNIAQKYAVHSDHPVCQSKGNVDLIIVGHNETTFSNILKSDHALHIAVYADEYLDCIALGTNILATLSQIISDIPVEVAFHVNANPAPEVLKSLTRP